MTGEEEEQILLTTEDRQPVSLSMLRRAGELPRLAVALGGMVYESAARPQRDSLLWYRLACFRPEQMPEMALDPEDARVAREDYQFVLNGLGPCGRTRQAP